MAGIFVRGLTGNKVNVFVDADNSGAFNAGDTPPPTAEGLLTTVEHRGKVVGELPAEDAAVAGLELLAHVDDGHPGQRARRPPQLVRRLPQAVRKVAAALDVVEVLLVRAAQVELGALGSVPRSVQDPLTSSAVNVEGTLKLLEFAQRQTVRRVAIDFVG